MIPPPDAVPLRAKLQVWWILWISVLGGLGLNYLFSSHRPPPPASANPLNHLAGFVPLFVSIIIRWLVLPRDHRPGGALVIYVAGILLAYGCGLLGLIFGGPYREILFVLGVLGILQFAPFYARLYYRPKDRGFIPNN